MHCTSTPVTRKLWVFDFDDTLVKTDARTRLQRADGTCLELTPSEFALHERVDGDVFDFTDFLGLINPRPIESTNIVFREACVRHGVDSVVVLSARSVIDPIQEYLTSVGLSDVKVVALGTADPTSKARWLSSRLDVGDIHEVEFFDDSHKNVEAVRVLAADHPNILFIVNHVS